MICPGEVSERLSEPARRSRISITFEDFLGAFALFVLLIMGIWVAYGSGLPTGGETLIAESP